MHTLIQTNHLPARERFAYWREMVLRLPVPVDVRCADQADFLAQLRTADLGALNFLSLSSRTPCEFRRTPSLIRRSDPEAYRLVLNVEGHAAIVHDNRDVSLHPGDLMLLDTSRPVRGWRGAEGESAEWIMVTYSRRLLPLPPKMVRRLVGARLPGQQGIGTLVSNFLGQAMKEHDHYQRADGIRLATIILDLIAALLAHELEAGNAAPPESYRQALMLQIQAFIARRLGDPDLSPGAIAAAHHISTRQLYKLFGAQDQTVAAWVRARRLESCRRELADPLLHALPVHAVAARWAFADAAHFSRVFRAAYGMSPQAYRQQQALARQSSAVHASSTTGHKLSMTPGPRSATLKV